MGHRIHRPRAVARRGEGPGQPQTGAAKGPCAEEIEVWVEAPPDTLPDGQRVAVVVSAGNLVIVARGGIEAGTITGEAAEHIRGCMALGYRFEGTAHRANGGAKVAVHGYRAS